MGHETSIGRSLEREYFKILSPLFFSKKKPFCLFLFRPFLFPLSVAQKIAKQTRTYIIRYITTKTWTCEIQMSPPFISMEVVIVPHDYHIVKRLYKVKWKIFGAKLH